MAKPVGSVVIVGGGFAGVGCAHVLAKEDVDVTLVDRNMYHQFQPLLYQLATAQLGMSDLARPLRGIFVKSRTVSVKSGDISAVDPQARTVTTVDGVSFGGDVLVLAGGAQPNFFGTPGAEEHAFPLYSVDHAERLRSRIIGILDAVDRDPTLIDKGALNFVIVGAGATGVEMAGALSEVAKSILPLAYKDIPAEQVHVIVVDQGSTVLNGFSDKAHHYATKHLEHNGVELRLGVGVAEVDGGKVVLSDGTEILTHLVVWAGGEKAGGIIEASGLPTGRGGRVDVEPDLTVAGFPGVYVLGDAANIAAADGSTLPQLGSVAQQSGRWAGKNIVADLTGKPRTAFDYHDKGIMAMVGRNAAIAELGEHRHELDGPLAYAAWLGVHASLLEGSRQKLAALLSWGWDYASRRRPDALVDRPDAYVIDWDDDPEDPAAEP